MIRRFVIVFVCVILLIGLWACQKQKPSVSEELERDVETLNNRVADLNKQLQDLRKSLQLLQKDVSIRVDEIETTMKRVESSRIESQIAVEEISRRIKGEKKLTVAEKKMFPAGVRILLLLVLLILIVILLKMAMSRAPDTTPSVTPTPEEKKSEPIQKTEKQDEPAEDS